MTFWSNSNFEPKRVFKWKLSVLSRADDPTTPVPSWFATKVGKPQFSIEEAKHNYMNKSFYFPGHAKWEPVKATLIDDVGGTIIDSITQAFGNSNYDLIANPAGVPPNLGPPNSASALKTISKGKLVANSSAQNATVLIEQLNSEGEVVEQITLHNAWIKSFMPSELTYETEDLSTYEVEFRYDWATYSSEPA